MTVLEFFAVGNIQSAFFLKCQGWRSKRWNLVLQHYLSTLCLCHLFHAKRVCF